MKKRVIRILSLVMALVMLVSSNAFAKTVSQYNSEISAVKAKQQAVAEEGKKLKARLEELRDQTEEAEAYQAVLEEQIHNYQESIDLALARINELNESISALEGEIDRADAEHEATFEKLKVRLRALYTAGGDLTTLEILLDSTSLRDFSMRREAVQRFTEHDKLLMEEIQAYMEETQAQRDLLNVQKAELAEEKKDLEKKQEELRVLEEENQRLIDELNVKSAEQAALVAKNEKESKQYLSEINKLIADRNAQQARDDAAKQQASSGGSVSPSGSGLGSVSFKWPLPGYGYGYITQKYGGMYSGVPHKGLDIGAPYGTPIVAAESGQVLSAEYHWSWGNNVLVWHNGTYSTRYAHCSSMCVSPGQYVQKGQIIGYVGSTGQSSGNHLHFEVYKNGTRVNPSNYV